MANETGGGDKREKVVDSAEPHPSWSFGPVYVKRTTDFLALVAFFLSLLGLLAQVGQFLKGDNTVLFTPDQITFGSSKSLKFAFQDNEQYMNLTGIMSYVNDASAGYNSAVEREYVRFKLGSHEYQYKAHQLINSGSEFVDGKVRLTVQKKEDSGPFAVTAGSAISHETLFVPHYPVKCRRSEKECEKRYGAGVRWADFLEIIRINPRIEIELIADTVGGEQMSARCIIILNENDIRSLEDGDQQWSGPNCLPVDDLGLIDRILR